MASVIANWAAEDTYLFRSRSKLFNPPPFHFRILFRPPLPTRFVFSIRLPCSVFCSQTCHVRLNGGCGSRSSSSRGGTKNVGCPSLNRPYKRIGTLSLTGQREGEKKRNVYAHIIFHYRCKEMRHHK